MTIKKKKAEKAAPAPTTDAQMAGLTRLAEQMADGVRDAAEAEKWVADLGEAYERAEVAVTTANDKRLVWADDLFAFFHLGLQRKLPRPNGEDGTVTQAELAALLTKHSTVKVTEAAVAIAVQTGLCRHVATSRGKTMPTALEVGKKLTTKVGNPDKPGKSFRIAQLMGTNPGLDALGERIDAWHDKVATGDKLPQMEAAYEVLKESKTGGTTSKGSPEAKFSKLLEALQEELAKGKRLRAKEMAKVAEAIGFGGDTNFWTAKRENAKNKAKARGKKKVAK